MPRISLLCALFTLRTSAKFLTAEEVGEVPPTSFRRRLLLVEEVLTIVGASRTRRTVVDVVWKRAELRAVRVGGC